jgi:hypothetical protein
MIGTRATNAQLSTYVANIVQAYRAATPDQLARGKCWYPVAHDLALVVGNGDVRMGAGVIAALSAQRSWKVNQALATDASNGNVHGQTEQTLAKVRAMLAGTDPADVLPLNLKTGHFFASISDPSDPDPVTIDRHAHDVATGQRGGERNRGLSNVTRYATLALAYRLAARQLGEIPSVVQAVTWCRQVDLNTAEESAS